MKKIRVGGPETGVASHQDSEAHLALLTRLVALRSPPSMFPLPLIELNAAVRETGD